MDVLGIEMEMMLLMKLIVAIFHPDPLGQLGWLRQLQHGTFQRLTASD